MASTPEELAERARVRDAEREARKTAEALANPPRVRVPLTPEQQAERDLEDKWGLSKSQKGAGWLTVDAIGHFFIAFGGGLVVTPLAYLAGTSLAMSGLIGTGLGMTAVGVREIIQLVGGNPHLKDRIWDMAPSPFGGLAGGIAAWFIASLLR